MSDPTGAGVPNATVTAKNVETNIEVTGTTGEYDNYTIPFLPPGTYSISAGGAGFKRAIRENIVLQVGGNTTFDLQVGDVAEQVTVTAAPPLLEESTATRESVIENLRVTELPLNGRNPSCCRTFRREWCSPGTNSSRVPLTMATTRGSR